MTKKLFTRLAVIPLALSLLGFSIPTFIPNSWAGIEAVEWEPLPWPGMDVTIGEEPEPLAAENVAGVIGHRVLNNATNLQARYMHVPGTEKLNSQTMAVIKNAISEQEETTGETFTPEAHAPGAGLDDRECVTGSTSFNAVDIVGSPTLGVTGDGTAVVCDVVLANGQIFGQKLRTVTNTGGSITQDETVTVYTDLETDESYSGNDIWTEEGAQFVWDAFVAAVKREAGAVGLTWVSGTVNEDIINRVLAATIVHEDSLYVTFPAGVSSPELQAVGIETTTEDITVVLPATTVEPVLNEVGKKIVAVTKNSATFEPPQVWAGHDFFDCEILACVSLTYDDGPSHLTGGILDAFAANHASATFFVLGHLAESDPETILRTFNEGHMVQNHSWSHQELTLIPNTEAAAELNQTNTAVYDITGVVPQTFRPPYGSVNDEILKIAQMPAILWDVDTNDWQQPSNDVLIQRAVYDAHPGAIVLQHDIHDNTAETVWEVIAGLRDRGFEMVNLEQLFGGNIPATGIINSANE